MFVKSDIARILPFDRYIFQKHQPSYVFSDGYAEIAPLLEVFSWEHFSW